MAAPLITAITTVPNRENATNQASFSNDADTFFSEVNGFQTEANAQAQYLDGVAAQVDADAATALSAKNSAVAAANYKGDWTETSDVKTGESYSYLGKEWIAKQDSVGVTPIEGAFWLEGFGDASNVNYDNTTSGLTATDVQGAIDEVEGRVDTAEADIIELSTANNDRTKAALNAAGSAPIYAARAWANIKTTGVVEILNSGNIIGITDNGVGNTALTFAENMQTVTYSTPISISTGGQYFYNTNTLATTGFSVNTFSSGSAFVDLASVSISVFE